MQTNAKLTPLLLAICLALSTFRIGNTSHFCAPNQNVRKCRFPIEN
nr:MAG TPA: hypothetical protein [Caudoviricetes sp.]